MNKKTHTLFTLVLVTLLVCTACAGGPAQAPKPADTARPAAVADGAPMVAIIPSDMSDPNLVYVSKRLENYCKELGFTPVVFDPQANAQTQANMIGNAVAQGAIAVVFDPIDSAALGTAIMEAKEAGVLVATVVGDIDKMYHDYRDVYVGPDDLKAGEIAALCFKENFPQGADIVCIEGAAGHSAQIRRSDGFDAGTAGGNINILDRKSCVSWSTSDAMTIAEDFIVMHGNKMSGIFCHWDNGAIGVVEALKAAQYKPGDIFMVAVDGCYNGFDLIREGWMYGTVMQDCDTIAKVCIESIKTLKDGGSVEKIINPDLILVTKENVESIDPGW